VIIDLMAALMLVLAVGMTLDRWLGGSRGKP
jgi:hypothetical protein